jgi:hypothetical protein
MGIVAVGARLRGLERRGAGGWRGRRVGGCSGLLGGILVVASLDPLGFGVEGLDGYVGGRVCWWV